MQFRLLLAIAGLETVDAQSRDAQLRFGTIDRDLQWLGVDAKQHLALGDLLIVFNGDFYNLTGNPRVDRSLGHPGVGVISGDEGYAGNVVGVANGGEEGGQAHHQPWPQFFLQGFLDGRLGREGLGSRDIDLGSHDRKHL
ncbi:hypothetical protein D3C85_921760 [compost metagenome]